MAAPWLDERSEMLESESNPTAMTVSKIISERVMTSAKPFEAEDAGFDFMSEFIY